MKFHLGSRAGLKFQNWSLPLNKNTKIDRRLSSRQKGSVNNPIGIYFLTHFLGKFGIIMKNCVQIVKIVQVMFFVFVSDISELLKQKRENKWWLNLISARIVGFTIVGSSKMKRCSILSFKFIHIILLIFTSKLLKYNSGKLSPL